MVSLILHVCLVLAVGDAPEPTVAWESHYGKAVDVARQQSKPLVVVLENSANPQQAFNEDALRQAAQNAEKLQNYELCRVDVSTDYGRKVAQAFGATTFPYTAVSDTATKFLTFRKAGPMSSAEWSRALASAHNVARPVTATVTSPAAPAVAAPVYAAPMQFYSPVQSYPGYCPSCQLRR